MTDTKKPFLDFSYLPTILSLAWPTMIEELMWTAVQYVDTAMVGSLGTRATAAVGSTSTVAWLVGSTLSSFGVGYMAYISQACGRKETENARKAIQQAILTSFVIGLLFSAATLGLSSRIPLWMQVNEEVRPLASRYFFILYLSVLPRTFSVILGTVLRAVGDTKTPMRVSVSMNIINILLNLVLIFDTRNVSLFGLSIPLPGVGLGVLGAAVASSLSYLYGGAAMLIAILRHKECSPKGLPLQIDKEILLTCLNVAVPNMLQRFASSMGYVIFASMINSLGEIATAAHMVANTVESAFYIPGFGMMSAAAFLTGNAIGARDHEKLTYTSRLIILIETSLMILSGSLLFIFAPQMASLFSKDAAVIQLASTVLRMVACSEPFFGIATVLEGMLQGAGETKIPFFVNILGMWGIRILGTFLCIRFLDSTLIHAWACMIGHNTFLFLCYLIYCAKRTWIPEKTLPSSDSV